MPYASAERQRKAKAVSEAKRRARIKAKTVKELASELTAELAGKPTKGSRPNSTGSSGATSVGAAPHEKGPTTDLTALADAIDLTTIAGALDTTKQWLRLTVLDPKVDSATKSSQVMAAARLVINAREASLETEVAALEATIERLRESRNAA